MTRITAPCKVFSYSPSHNSASLHDQPTKPNTATPSSWSRPCSAQSRQQCPFRSHTCPKHQPNSHSKSRWIARRRNQTAASLRKHVALLYCSSTMPPRDTLIELIRNDYAERDWEAPMSSVESNLRHGQEDRQSWHRNFVPELKNPKPSADTSVQSCTVRLCPPHSNPHHRDTGQWTGSLPFWPREGTRQRTKN